MCPVGRWASNKTVDNFLDYERNKDRSAVHKSELELIKEQEQQALSEALGFLAPKVKDAEKSTVPLKEAELLRVFGMTKGEDDDVEGIFLKIDFLVSEKTRALEEATENKGLGFIQ